MAEEQINLLNTIPPRNPEISLELSEIDPVESEPEPDPNQLTVDDALNLDKVHAGDVEVHDKSKCNDYPRVFYRNMKVGTICSKCSTCGLVVTSKLDWVGYHGPRTK